MKVVSGLRYIPEFISTDAESELINQIDSQHWLNDLKRRVQHYGYKYDYKARNLTQEFNLGPMPDWLLLYSRKLFFDGFFDKVPDQVIINEYLPGQGISPHIDCIPCFEENVASLSLASLCVMDFTKGKEKISLFLEPRSLLILSGEARFNWKHSIPSRKTDYCNNTKIPRERRLSLTFRNVILGS